MGAELGLFLMTIYARLGERYGPQHWWPGETPYEVAVGAILTQSTAWTNVARAIANLKEAGVLSPAAMDALPLERLEELIRPSGYYHAKARKLKAFLALLAEEFDGDLARLWALPGPELRGRLLATYGIGPETADSICLYAAGAPCFVVDAYTRRVFARLGLVDEPVTYDELRALFTDKLPPDVALFNEYHALIVRHGKEVCQKRPRCAGCVLADLCPTAWQGAEGRQGRDEVSKCTNS
jgi:endonuclease III related protein